MSQRVQSIVIVGRDIDAWISALALRRAFGNGVKVTVLELPSLLLASDVYAAVPAITLLHKMLRVDDHKVASLCSGAPMIAQRFSNWGRAAPAFLHPYDAPDPPSIEASFIHYWVKGRSSGLGVAYEDFSLAAAAAKQGRIPVREAMSGAAYPLPGWQLDARSYAGMMKHLALKLGIEHRTGRTASMELDGDRIAALRWDDGEMFEADLFIDASAAEALLIRGMPGAGLESWREWLPCDHILTASGPRLRPLPAFSNVSAFRGGWVALHPLQDRTAVVAALSREHSNDQMLQNLAILAGTAIEGDAVITPLEAGIQRSPWIGNCVAVGTAAATLEPLDSALLYLLHLGIAQLIAVLGSPGDPVFAPEAYNGAVAKRAQNIRDFQIAHYRLNRRFDEPMWDNARSASGPASLDARINAFKAEAKVPVDAGEPFDESNWTAILVGHGVVPQAHDPRVDRSSDEQNVERVHQRLQTIAQAVARMPTTEEYLSGSLNTFPAPDERVS